MPARITNLCAVSFGAALLVGAAAGRAQTYPAGFTGTELISSGMSACTAMARAPDGRIYITEQGGALRVWDPSTGLQAGAFSTFPVDFGGERGLIGVAVDPNWSSNHYIYVHYSRSSPANGAIIRRITADGANPNVAVSNSAVTVLDLGDYPTSNTWHVGGGIHFGPDGKLYIGLGENGVSSNSQSIGNVFGKLLRINPDPANPVPTDNPASFAGIVGTTSGNNRIIRAVGLRNPFTFAFHPVSGRLFIDDVGQNDWEEIDEWTAGAGGVGANFGWSITEGDFDPAAFPNFRRPFYTYEHGGSPVGGFCIVGGAFYQPPEHAFPPDYFGDYFFGDYISAWVKRVDVTTKTVTDFADNVFNLVELTTDPQGRVLLLTNDGPPKLIRVDYAASLGPTVLTHPAPVTVGAGGTAQFSVYAAGNRTLTYLWRRNTVPLSNGGQYSGANTATLTVSGVTCQSSGSFDCVVGNGAGNATSNAAALTGAPACYANCDCSGGTPQFNVADFTCFVQKFSAGDPYANCDGSTVAPTLNIFDFVCFMGKAAAGCP